MKSYLIHSAIITVIIYIVDLIPINIIYRFVIKMVAILIYTTIWTAVKIKQIIKGDKRYE